MLRDDGCETIVDEWSGWTYEIEPREEAWRACDQRLRANAKRRHLVEAEELELLREAEALQIWRPLGMVSMIDYMERVLGYGPETAHKRLRVARRLAELPVLSAALRDGELAFSAVRELCRVATPATEQAWRDAAIEQPNLREIEALVSGHVAGDLPDDPPDPEVRTRTVSFELSPSTYALLREARRRLDDEHGARIDDDMLIAAMASAVLDRAATGAGGGAGAGSAAGAGSGAGAGSDTEARAVTDGRARFQIALTVCARCKAGTKDGAGATVAVDAATVARAECDAQHIGSIDAAVPARAHQDIPPAVVRLIWRRDHGRCQTPGCRSARGLEIHHILHRANGGTHDPSNLTLRCSACHIAHHEGRITIGGIAPDRLTLTRNAQPPMRPDDVHRARPGRLAAATRRVHARDALTALGWKPAIATSAVDAAIASVRDDAPLEEVIREALRRCPRPLA